MLANIRNGGEGEGRRREAEGPSNGGASRVLTAAAAAAVVVVVVVVVRWMLLACRVVDVEASVRYGQVCNCCGRERHGAAAQARAVPVRERRALAGIECGGWF